MAVDSETSICLLLPPTSVSLSKLISLSYPPSGTFRLHSSLDDASELEWLCWHPSADILLAGACDGCIWMWLVPTKTAKVREED